MNIQHFEYDRILQICEIYGFETRTSFNSYFKASHKQSTYFKLIEEGIQTCWWWILRECNREKWIWIAHNVSNAFDWHFIRYGIIDCTMHECILHSRLSFKSHVFLAKWKKRLRLYSLVSTTHYLHNVPQSHTFCL